MINDFLKVESIFSSINKKRQEQLRVLVEKRSINEVLKDSVIVERIDKNRL